MRIKALTFRILKQIIHDKRTLALILIAPIILLSLVYFVFEDTDTSYKIGVINAPEEFLNKLIDNDDYDIEVININKSQITDYIKNGDVIATIDISNDLSSIDISIDGTNVTDSNKVQSIIKNTTLSYEQDLMKKMNKNSIEPEFSTDYVYGSDNNSSFDNFGAPLVGIMVFFFVFLIAGINFLTERTSGTLEKLFSTPIRRYEIIIGYVLGFSLLAILQTSIISLFVIYVLKLNLVGSIWYVLLINILTAINALTLGILLSTIAHSEFQMIQFVPIVIIPQIFLCGLFNLSGIWEKVGYITPLHYTSNALTEVMIRGNGFSSIWVDCSILLLTSIIMMMMNTKILRK